MSMDVSTLAIEVKSKGITPTVNALDKLTAAADRAEKSADKLTATLTKLMNVNTSATAQAWAASMGQLNSAVGVLNGTMNTLMKTLNSMPSSFQVMTSQVNSTREAMDRSNYSGGVMANTWRAMLAAASAYVGVNFAKSIVTQADAWQNMQARLQLATGTMVGARQAQEQIFDLSQRLRAPLADMTQLYTRLAPAVRKMGQDADFAKNMVEGVATALRLGGANGAETSSVMLQLSQSFGSGVLNGAEFNAVAENGQVIMRALTEYTGKTTAELKKMGSQGKLTMDTVTAAISAALPKWREDFDKLPLTFEGGMERIKNAWTKAVGQLGENTKFNQELSQGLRGIEEMLPAIAQELGTIFKATLEWINDNKSGLADVWEQLKAILATSLAIGDAFFSWIAKLAGATTALEGVAVVFKGVRIVVAVIADAIAALAKPIINVGVWVYEHIVGSFLKVREVAAEISLGLADITAMRANIAKKAGNEEEFQRLSEEIRLTVKQYNDAVDASAKFKEELKGLYGLARSGDPNAFLHAALNYEQDITAEKQKQKAVADAMAHLYSGQGIFQPFSAGDKQKTAEDPKLTAALAAETRKYNNAMDQANAALKLQIDLQDSLAEKGKANDKAVTNSAQQKVNELEEHLKTLKQIAGTSEAGLANKQEQAHVANEIAIWKETAARMTYNDALQKAIALQNTELDAEKAKTKTIQDQATVAQYRLQTYGLEKGAIQQLELADARRAEMALLSSGELSTVEQGYLTDIQNRIKALNDLAAAETAIGSRDNAKDFDKLFDERRAEKFGNVLADGFGKAGKALGKLANAWDQYGKRQAKVMEAYKLADKQTDPKVRAVEVQKASELEAESRVASYADMAGAAKAFFKEGSTGYKAMQAAETTFRVFQMAMQVKSFLQEMGFITATTTASVAATTAKTTAEVASVAPTVAAQGAKASASGTAALANALTAPWPANIAAFAMVAAMLAAIGVAVSGGGGGISSSAQRQATQGTGTVFGDDKAKSESISKSIEILSKNSDIALRYSSGMLSSLQNIEVSLTGATSGIIRTGGSVTGKNYSGSSSMFGGVGGALGATVLGGVSAPILELASKLPLIGNLVSKLVGGLFGSSSTLKDSGLIGKNQSIADILQSGFSVQGYQDVQTKKKAFGITYSNKTKTNLSAVDPAISNEFGNIIEGMVSSLSNAAGALGMNVDSVRQKLTAMNIDIGKISLKDLSSEEVQKQLEAVFSAIGDKLATAALPSVVRFQKAGEGLLETAVRVASGVENANYELEKLGINAVDLSKISADVNDVGAEIVRQSLLVVEAGTGIGDILSTITGEAADIAATYKSLLQARQSLQALGIAKDVTTDLIKAAGGLDALQSSLDAYTQNFFTDAEQQAMKVSALQKEFAKLGLTMPATKDAFRALVTQLSSGNEASQELAIKVLGLADAFSQLSDSTDELISNARNDLTDAYNREADAIKETQSKFEDFIKSLGDFKQSLLTGDLSTLDVAQKYALEKAKFEDVTAKALGGDENAIAAFQDQATAFLNASRSMNASGDQYTTDFQRVLDMIDAVSGASQGKVDTATQQLDALNKQVEGLITINESVLSVTDAINNLTALLSGSSTSTGTSTNPGIMPVNNMATAQDAAPYQATSPSWDALKDLTTQVVSLTAEVTQLRADQQAQTTAMIESNYEANMANAAMVNEGTKDTASSTSYAQRAQVTLA